MSQETIHAAERAAGQVKTMSTYDPDSDQLHEECGIFGVWAPDRDVARLTYFGLRALQHRGQESAGIAVGDGGTVMVRKDLGLLDRVFSNADLSTLSGQLAGERRQVGVGEHAIEQSQVFANHNRAAITHGDSRRFLAAMLQRAQTKVRQSSHIAIGRPHTKNAAFLMQLVGVRIIRRHGLHLSRGALGRVDGFLRHGIPSEPRYLALPALLYARQDKHSRA